MRKTFRSLLDSGRKFTGCYMQYPSLMIVETMALAGLDFVILDLEHGYFSESDLMNMIVACDANGLAAMVRVPNGGEEHIKRVLDMGATAIKVPGVSTVEQAEQIVSYCKYPPIGVRGACSMTRGNGYGTDRKNFWQRANRDVVVSLLVEGVEGIHNLEQIVSVDGVDCISIGSGDLCMALGLNGQPRHPKIMEAQKECAELCAKYGKSCSAKGKNLEDVKLFSTWNGISHFHIMHPEEAVYESYKTHIDQMRALVPQLGQSVDEGGGQL